MPVLCTSHSTHNICAFYACLYQCLAQVVYEVATISRGPKDIGLFFKRALQKRLYSAKEPYILRVYTIWAVHKVTHIMCDVRKSGAVHKVRWSELCTKWLILCMMCTKWLILCMMCTKWLILCMMCTKWLILCVMCTSQITQNRAVHKVIAHLHGLRVRCVAVCCSVV